jgi:hypothetical protein
MYIMTPELIYTAYIINHSHQPLCLYVQPLVVVAGQRSGENPSTLARQRLGKIAIGGTDTHAIDELLDASFLFYPCQFFPELIVIISLSYNWNEHEMKDLGFI